MDYPIWNVPFFGGGVLIAWIAVIHVYVAHFAVGGGLFLPLTELKGHRENSPEILAYAKRHTLFFLLLTMVFGSLTGVAIWFIIALTSPTATLTLIRAFTFAWSTEWVFFVGEIVALLVYYYTFGKMRRREHLTVGWIYFAFGFLSLFIINGIIGAMLLPGRWLETQSFWDGFFNPAFWPQLAFRSMMCFSIAGLFGFFTATRMADPKVRDSLMRYTAKWTCIPLVLMVPAGWWCYAVLPEGRQVMVDGWTRSWCATCAPCSSAARPSWPWPWSWPPRAPTPCASPWPWSCWLWGCLHRRLRVHPRVRPQALCHHRSYLLQPGPRGRGGRHQRNGLAGAHPVGQTQGNHRRQRARRRARAVHGPVPVLPQHRRSLQRHPAADRQVQRFRHGTPS
jgi:hypothetical protein